jgi:hypothetical protein
MEFQNNKKKKLLNLIKPHQSHKINLPKINHNKQIIPILSQLYRFQNHNQNN